jgi:hypothetical protein
VLTDPVDPLIRTALDAIDRRDWDTFKSWHTLKRTPLWTPTGYGLRDNQIYRWTTNG